MVEEIILEEVIEASSLMVKDQNMDLLLRNNENFQRKIPGRNNHNAPKLIEKYNNLAREAFIHWGQNFVKKLLSACRSFYQNF
jgi:hypothetical protein